jgi:hypothetical protein
MLNSRMVELIEDAYIRRIQEGRPPMDKSTLEGHLRFMPIPPTWLVEKALAERMHLHEEERMQQVAHLMVMKHLLPWPQCKCLACC